MKKVAICLFLFALCVLFFSGVVNTADNKMTKELAEAKQIIDARVSCDKLTDDQFEALGEYYMEQMHPGEAHERMDRMMGGEGSERLRQMHIHMGKRMYCYGYSMGMMGGMMGNTSSPYNGMM